MTDNVSDLTPRKIPLGLPNEQGKGGSPYRLSQGEGKRLLT